MITSLQYLQFMVFWIHAIFAALSSSTFIPKWVNHMWDHYICCFNYLHADIDLTLKCFWKLFDRIKHLHSESETIQPWIIKLKS